MSKAARVSRFVADVCLMDYELLRYSASLRAQVVMMFGIYATGVTVSSAQGTKTADSNINENQNLINWFRGALKQWDSHKHHYCKDNKSIEVALCVQAVSHVIIHGRRELKQRNLEYIFALFYHCLFERFTPISIVPAVKIVLTIKKVHRVEA